MKPSSEGRLNILHITFNMGIGGTEQVIRQLVAHLPVDQFANHILCIDGEVGPLGNLIVEEGGCVTSIARTPGFDWALIRHIRAIIKEKVIDIVHCHQYTPFVYGWFGALGTSARLVFTEHGRFFPDRYRFRAVFINPMMALTAGSVVAISHATKNALSRYEFIPRSKIEVIYNGIKPLTAGPKDKSEIKQSLGVPADTFVFGTVSRLDPIKNQELMLRAFARFREINHDSMLLVVGDGPDKGSLVQLARELDIERSVWFVGFITQPCQHMAAMDVFLLSSHTEGTSMTLLETMSLGIPVIATNVGGNPEIVKDKQTGLLTSPGSVEDFLSAMNGLYENSQKRESMSAESIKRFRQRFAADQMAKAYGSIYKRLAKDRS
ncbi:MAG: glycosyltransferase [Sphingobacterium sp.]